jgi:hypothetical protein
MANLPLTGSQYWGAALNNYLRQVSSDVEDLKIQLANFSVTASFNGSGWKEGFYNLVDCVSMTPIAGNTGVYQLTDSSAGVLVGTLIFCTSSGTVSIPLERASGITMTCAASSNDSTKKPIKQLTYNTSDKKYEVEERSQTLNELLTTNGFYPVYAISDGGQSFSIAVNPNGEFIFSEGFVMLGLIEKSSSNEFRFIKKTDSAYKSLYSTRHDNLNSYATITNTKGLLSVESNGLFLNLSSAWIDYNSNGISEKQDAASEISDSNKADYKIPQDYKRFTSAGRRAYKIVTTGSGNSISHTWTSVTIQDALISSVFSTSQVYGIYISAGGDIFIEEGPAAYSPMGEGKVSSLNTSHAWTLNTDTHFRTGGLVLIGAFYYDTDIADWQKLQAASNSISPSFITNKYVESAEVIRWPSVTFSTNTTRSGTTDDYHIYQYHVAVDATDVISKTGTINMYMDYHGSGTDKNKYVVPVFPDAFISCNVSNQAFDSMRLGAMKLKYATTAPVTITETGKLTTYGGLVSTTSAEQLVSDIGVRAQNVLRSTVLLGDTTIGSTTNDSISIKGAIKDISAITASSSGLSMLGKTTFSEDLHLNNSLVFDNSDKQILADNKTLTIKAGTLKLDLGNALEVNHNILFTSDERCKYNINNIDTQACINAVKNIDIKTFNYRKNDIPSIGVIAQDIEKYLPEYADLLVTQSSEGDLNDKRNVAEIKLLFILWQAVKSLLK